MWLLKSSEPLSLRATVGVLLLAQTMEVAHQLWVASSGRVFNAALAVTLLLVAIGLYKRLHWGRTGSVVFLWGIILLEFGSMSPFRVIDDMAAGIEPPSVIVLATRFFVACCFSLSCMHFLGKHKEKFRAAWL